MSIKESSVAKLGSVCRRVYRIFSHAYFHHRSVFDDFEVSNILFIKDIDISKKCIISKPLNFIACDQPFIIVILTYI